MLLAQNFKVRNCDNDVSLFQIFYTLGLTEGEIGTLPDETRIYESVGRMFILSDKQTVAGRLTDKQSSCQEKVTYFIVA